MRIDLNVTLPESNAAKPANSTSQKSAPPSDRLAVDSADLSTSDNRVSTLVNQANQVAEIRQDKVYALANQIQDGTYQTTPEQTAEAIMGHLTIPPRTD